MRILTALMVFILLLAACREERKVDVAAGLNPEKMATMTTKNISTLISDSGVIQYKIVAPLWQVFDEADTLTGIFQKGCSCRNTTRIFRWWQLWRRIRQSFSRTSVYGVSKGMWR